MCLTLSQQLPKVAFSCFPGVLLERLKNRDVGLMETWLREEWWTSTCRHGYAQACRWGGSWRRMVRAFQSGLLGQNNWCRTSLVTSCCAKRLVLEPLQVSVNSSRQDIVPPGKSRPVGTPVRTHVLDKRRQRPLARLNKNRRRSLRPWDTCDRT